jgi:hypothetical protein
MGVSGQLHTRLLYPKGKSHRYLFDGRLAGPRRRPWTVWKRKTSMFQPEIEPRIPGRPARSQVTILDKNLRYFCSINISKWQNTVQPRYSEKSKCPDHRIVRINAFQIKKLYFLVKSLIEKIYSHILYITTGTHGRYKPGSGEAATGLHLSPPREAGPLTHGIMFHKDSFLLQGSKIIKLSLTFLEVPICFWWYCKSVRITGSTDYRSSTVALCFFVF